MIPGPAPSRRRRSRSRTLRLSPSVETWIADGPPGLNATSQRPEIAGSRTGSRHASVGPCHVHAAPAGSATVVVEPVVEPRDAPREFPAPKLPWIRPTARTVPAADAAWARSNAPPCRGSNGRSHRRRAVQLPGRCRRRPGRSRAAPRRSATDRRSDRARRARDRARNEPGGPLYARATSRFPLSFWISAAELNVPLRKPGRAVPGSGKDRRCYATSARARRCSAVPRPRSCRGCRRSE